MTISGAEIPAIPDILVKDPELRAILLALKQIAEIRNNRLGDTNQRFITYYELIDYLAGNDQLTVVAVTGGHNHDTLYSAITHNHNALYSAVGHDHDSVYLQLANIGFTKGLEDFATWGVNAAATVTVTGTGATDLQTAVTAAVDGDVIEVKTNATYDEIVLPADKALVIRGAFGYAPLITGSVGVTISDGTRDILVARFSFPDCDCGYGAVDGNGAGCAVAVEHRGQFNRVVFYQCAFLEPAQTSTMAVIIAYHQSHDGDNYLTPPVYPTEFSYNFGVIDCDFYYACVNKPNEGAAVLIRGVENVLIKGNRINGAYVDSRGIMIHVCKNVWIVKNKCWGFRPDPSTVYACEAIKLDNIGGSTEITTAVVMDNECWDAGEGVDVDDYVSAFVQNNHCHDCFEEGISVDGDSFALIMGNVCHDNVDGIRLETAVVSSELFANNCYDNSGENYRIQNGYTLPDSNISERVYGFHSHRKYSPIGHGHAGQYSEPYHDHFQFDEIESRAYFLKG